MLYHKQIVLVLPVPLEPFHDLIYGKFQFKKNIRMADCRVHSAGNESK